MFGLSGRYTVATMSLWMWHVFVTMVCRSLKALLGHGLLRDCRSVTSVYECTLQPAVRPGYAHVFSRPHLLCPHLFCDQVMPTFVTLAFVAPRFVTPTFTTRLRIESVFPIRMWHASALPSVQCPQYKDNW